MKYVVEVQIIIEADNHDAAMDLVDDHLDMLYAIENFEVNAAWPLDSQFTWKD